MDVALRGAIRACHAGLDSVALRRTIAARVAPVLGFDANAFSTCDPDTGLQAHTVADGVTPEFGAAYTRRLYPEVAVLASEMLHRGRLVFSVPEYSPRVREELAAHGVVDQLYVAVPIHGRQWASWCLMRGKMSTRTLAQSASFLRRLLPHLARGLQAAVALAVANAPNLDGAAVGTVLVDGRNRVVLRTAGAAAVLLDLADVGFDLGDELPSAVRSVVLRLQRMHADAAPSAFTRTRGRSGRWYRIEGALAEPDADGRSVVVVTIRAALRREVASFLTPLYKLSAREREVVAAVLRGEATKSIAAALGISPYTVQEHLDRACSKIGARGRKALVAKLFADGYAPGSTAAARGA